MLILYQNDKMPDKQLERRKTYLLFGFKVLGPLCWGYYGAIYGNQKTIHLG